MVWSSVPCSCCVARPLGCCERERRERTACERKGRLTPEPSPPAICGRGSVGACRLLGGAQVLARGRCDGGPGSSRGALGLCARAADAACARVHAVWRTCGNAVAPGLSPGPVGTRYSSTGRAFSGFSSLSTCGPDGWPNATAGTGRGARCATALLADCGGALARGMWSGRVPAACARLERCHWWRRSADARSAVRAPKARSGGAFGAACPATLRVAPRRVRNTTHTSLASSNFRLVSHARCSTCHCHAEKTNPP